MSLNNLFDDFAGFERVLMILEGSDTDFNMVLMRSPSVFGICIMRISRFLAEIYDFD